MVRKRKIKSFKKRIKKVKYKLELYSEIYYIIWFIAIRFIFKSIKKQLNLNYLPKEHTKYLKDLYNLIYEQLIGVINTYLFVKYNKKLKNKKFKKYINKKNKYIDILFLFFMNKQGDPVQNRITQYAEIVMSCIQNEEVFNELFTADPLNNSIIPKSKFEPLQFPLFDNIDEEIMFVYDLILQANLKLNYNDEYYSPGDHLE